MHRNRNEIAKIMIKGGLAMMAIATLAGFVQGLIWEILWKVIDHSEKNI